MYLTIFVEKFQIYSKFGPYNCVQISPTCNSNTYQIIYEETTFVFSLETSPKMASNFVKNGFKKSLLSKNSKCGGVLTKQFLLRFCSNFTSMKYKHFWKGTYGISNCNREGFQWQICCINWLSDGVIMLL